MSCQSKFSQWPALSILLPSCTTISPYPSYIRSSRPPVPLVPFTACRTSYRSCTISFPLCCPSLHSCFLGIPLPVLLFLPRSRFLPCTNDARCARKCGRAKPRAPVAPRLGGDKQTALLMPSRGVAFQSKKASQFVVNICAGMCDAGVILTCIYIQVSFCSQPRRLPLSRPRGRRYHACSRPFSR